MRMLRRLITQLVKRLGKHKSFSLDPRWSTRDIVSMLFQMMAWTARGTLVRLRLGYAAGLIMVGHGVRIRYPRYLRVGRNFVVEDYAEVVALSRHGIVCGDNVTIGAFSSIKPTNYYGMNMGEGLSIGDNSNIGRYSYVGCSGYIKIGRNVMISPRVSLFAENHNHSRTDIPMRDQGVSRESIVIEDDCWIASGATILAGVTVGRGTIVAAGAVVTKDVEPYSIVGGVPARAIGHRLHTTKGTEQQLGT